MCCAVFLYVLFLSARAASQMQACAAPTHTYMSLLPLPLLYFMSLQSTGGVLLSLRAFWVMTCVLTGYRQFGEVAALSLILHSR
jgi:hypothetical protein